MARALELRGFDGRLAALPPWRPRSGETVYYVAAALLLGATVAETLAWAR